MSTESMRDATSSEILYKLGGLESYVKESMNRIDKQIESLHDEIRADKTTVMSELADVKNRVGNLEKFKSDIVSKFSVIVLGIVGFWSIFGEDIHNMISKVL